MAHLRKFVPLARAGVRKFDFMGGRRSGKTYFICQTLLIQMLRGDVVNVATMTSEQGRLGAYADCVSIINGSPKMQPLVEIYKSPREIRCKLNGGRIFFNSYQNSEHAKGIACDWLYINEANNFTEQQYIDLSASVRKGTFADRNPNSVCWTEQQGFALIHSMWQDNKEHLTAEQIAWFDGLKARAEAADATAADVAFYRMYYLGEYADVVGTIFTPANMQRVDVLPPLRHLTVYCDPSALVGSDYFACVLSGVFDDKVYIVDTYSVNAGTRDDVVLQLKQWCRSYDVEWVYVETNGYIGGEFYHYAKGVNLPLRAFRNSTNKYERIVANYENLTTRLLFLNNEHNNDYLKQVYTFAKNCEHDDNIDAVDAVFRLHRYVRNIN